MVLFLVLSTLYLASIIATIMYVDFKGRNIFFWGLVTYIFTPIVTIIFMLCLGDSESKKEEDAQSALMRIRLLEYEVINDWGNKGYLLPYLKERGEERMEEQRMAQEQREIKFKTI